MAKGEDERLEAASAVSAFERRQDICELLQEQSEVRVNELAEMFDVSRVTIRNDLQALEEEGVARRVRGGAVLRKGYVAHSPAFEARARVNASAKLHIARWAADMVSDGETILLDASTTVFHMVPWLQARQNLTIVTNSIEVGAALSANPAHVVILIGGVLSPRGTSVSGHLAERNLEDLHVRKAFVSCTGFSIEAGLTQTDLHDAEVKARMVGSAEQVVALVDSTKFGKRDLTLFARLDQIAHVVTDSDASAEFVAKLRQAGISVTVCNENTRSTFGPLDAEQDRYRIGFGNLQEQSAFAVDVRHGLEQAARRIGNVDLIEADNRLDGAVALQMADHLVAAGVDLAIEYQIDEGMGVLIGSKFNQAGIPVIAVDIPVVGATYFGVDNYHAGRMAGVELGNWIVQHWAGQFDRLIVLQEPRAGALPAARIQGQLDGLRQIIGDIPDRKVTHLNSGPTADVSESDMLQVLEELTDEHRLAVISFNDSTTIGALNAARSMGREGDVIIVGQGADRRVREEIRRPGSRIAGATAYWPERYGEKLMDLALQILKGEKVAPAVYIDHVFINADNINEFYPE